MGSVLSEDMFDALLAGELDSLEGADEAVAIWDFLSKEAKAKLNYDRATFALRILEQVPEKRPFSDSEQDALWNVVWSGVNADAMRRTGLSKQALRHLTIPSLVNSIVAALGKTDFRNSSAYDEVRVEVSVPNATETTNVEVSIAALGGELSLRVHKNEELDVRVGVGGDGVSTASVSTHDIGNWQAVDVALRELSRRTTELLGADALVNCRVSITNGKAEVHMRPLHLAPSVTKK